MRKPIQDGFQSLIRTQAKVVSKLAPGHSAKYLVRPQGAGELWSASSPDALEIRDWVNIVATKGISVVIERADNGNDEIDNARTKLAGAENNERHCH